MINPNPVAFNIFGKDIYWYGIIIAIGVLLAIYLALQGAKKYGWKQDDILDFAIYAIPSGIISARLYYVIFAWDNYAADPITALYVWQGGVAIYGAIIGGLIAALIFTKVRKLNLFTLMDIIAPGLVIAQAMGRWGNFFNQEAYGAEVTNPALQWFPLAVKIDLTDTIHYATFFYESLWCFIIFLVIIALRNRFRHKGDVFLIYIGMYSFERMLVEGLRTDSLYMFGTIRVSQLLSLLLLIAVVAFFFIRAAKEKKNGIIPEYVMLSEFAYKKKGEITAKDPVKSADEPAEQSGAEQDEAGEAEDKAETEEKKED